MTGDFSVIFHQYFFKLDDDDDDDHGVDDTAKYDRNILQEILL